MDNADPKGASGGSGGTHPDEGGGQAGQEGSVEGILDLDTDSWSGGESADASPSNEGASISTDSGADCANQAEYAEVFGEESKDVVPEVRAKKAPYRYLTVKLVARAVKEAGGHVNNAAAALGVSGQQLYRFIAKNKQLEALYASRKLEDATPGELDTFLRDKLPDGVQGDAALADKIRRQDLQMMRDGFEKAGISRDTLDKLKIFDEFAPSAGRFLVASLDLSHKLMVYQNVSLFEQGEFIKKNYLQDPTCPQEIKIEWQKAYNEIAELIGKGYDRTLQGTNTMAKIMSEREKKRVASRYQKKAGFSPLVKEASADGTVAT